METLKEELLIQVQIMVEGCCAALSLSRKRTFTLQSLSRKNLHNFPAISQFATSGSIDSRLPVAEFPESDSLFFNGDAKLRETTNERGKIQPHPPEENRVDDKFFRAIHAATASLSEVSVTLESS